MGYYMIVHYDWHINNQSMNIQLKLGFSVVFKVEIHVCTAIRVKSEIVLNWDKVEVILGLAATIVVNFYDYSGTN